MSFLDSTPIGRVLNRFSKVTVSLNNEISLQIKILIHTFTETVGIVVMPTIYVPWFAIALPFLVVFFFAITDLYQATAREVKTLEAINRSFIFNNFNEVKNGAITHGTDSLKRMIYCQID
jgi:ABC-type multidrug transport system fused ATPase/permease subunit